MVVPARESRRSAGTTVASIPSASNLLRAHATLGVSAAIVLGIVVYLVTRSRNPPRQSIGLLGPFSIEGWRAEPVGCLAVPARDWDSETMRTMHRVLPSAAFESLEEYIAEGGGAGLRKARELSPDAILAEMDASGLRGRGGAGFPTGRKWRTVVANRSAVELSTVVVNAAEGEPGSFKDRAILRANPYAVLEGALIAAQVIGAEQVIIAMKGTFTAEIARVDVAITQLDAAGWTGPIDISIFEGPREYLFGEETALLESIDGRHPLPRVAPPFRRGVDEIVDSSADVGSQSGSAAHVELAGPGSESIAAPALVSNTETFANVPGIVARGAKWFRSVGTSESPGTIVCTITGATNRHGVAEVAMGTTLREAIATIGGGAKPGHRIVAAMSGVANAVVGEADLDVPLSYESLAGIGSGLGAAGFIVFDDATDLVAVAAGTTRFLAVESCGQCARCKQDGLAIAERLTRLALSEPAERDLDETRALLATVTEGARCNLAYQQERVAGSILAQYAEQVDGHAERRLPGREPMLIAAIVELNDGHAALDQEQSQKQPDWTYDATDSGQWPADRLSDHRHKTEL